MRRSTEAAADASPTDPDALPRARSEALVGYAAVVAVVAAALLAVVMQQPARIGAGDGPGARPDPGVTPDPAGLQPAGSQGRGAAG